ncbi:MAG: metal-dependent transcriptional regulator [Candidatus Cloacimonetes bacterium]|nr:metal-dependent transcriptional regulator [Candidatus Cloacimonadota bacterium]
MAATSELSASLEDYLEAIYHLVKEKQAARVKDIAERLHVKAASVTGALRALSERELVNYTPYEIVTFTRSGEAAALDVVRRHSALKDFFVKILLVDEASADSAACAMEHSVTRPLLERFVHFTQFVEDCPRAGTKWVRGFSYYCDHDSKQDNCEKCMRTNLDEVIQKKANKGAQAMTEQQLGSLKPGQKAKIVRVALADAASRRLVEMGMTVGTMVEVIKVAPLGDPVEIKLRGYHLSVRKKEAEGIYVEQAML